jgi:hypothetical protein
LDIDFHEEQLSALLAQYVNMVAPNINFDHYAWPIVGSGCWDPCKVMAGSRLATRDWSLGMPGNGSCARWASLFAPGAQIPAKLTIDK